MGIGKTIQAMAFLAHLAEEKNIWGGGAFLVVAPTSVLNTWADEIGRFCPDLKTLPYWAGIQERTLLRKNINPKRLYCRDAGFHILITSYQLLVSDEKYFRRVKWQYMVFDEAQAIKSSTRVVATAVTYTRRVYTRRSMTEYDPRLVAPSCLYLASKSEESTVQARLLVFYIKKLHSDEKYRCEIKEILEMEMKILEALNYYLVVFHPYRALSQLVQDAGMSDATQLTWGLVNDTYKMDLILIHPPHLIGLACIYVASVLKEKENTPWFEDLRVDMNVVKNIAMEILDFYDTHKMISDERVNAAMLKLAIRT